MNSTYYFIDIQFNKSSFSSVHSIRRINIQKYPFNSIYCNVVFQTKSPFCSSIIVLSASVEDICAGRNLDIGDVCSKEY